MAEAKPKGKSSAKTKSSTSSAKKTSKKTVVDHVIVYKDKDRLWRWRALTSSGETVSDSPEAYRNRIYTLRIAGETFPGALVQWGRI